MADLIDSYSEANYDENVNLTDHHPSPDAWSAGGQSFTGQAKKLTSVKFYVGKSGSPTGYSRAVLYAHSGTFGTSSVPTGEALATSDDFDVSTLGVMALVTFTFTGAQQYVMSADTYYCIIYENPAENGSTIDGSNYVIFAQDGSSPTHGGNRIVYASGNYYPESSRDSPFYVYGEAVAGGLSIPVAMHHYSMMR